MYSFYCTHQRNNAPCFHILWGYHHRLSNILRIPFNKGSEKWIDKTRIFSEGSLFNVYMVGIHMKTDFISYHNNRQGRHYNGADSRPLCLAQKDLINSKTSFEHHKSCTDIPCDSIEHISY